MTTLSREINVFKDPEPPQMSPSEAQKTKKIKKISMRTSTTDNDDPKYAPRLSRRRTWTPKRPMVIIDARATGLIFGAVGPPTVL